MAGREREETLEKERVSAKCVAVCCSVLQCVAVCCSVLQCVAVCCSVLQCVAVEERRDAREGKTCQRMANSHVCHTWLAHSLLAEMAALRALWHATRKAGIGGTCDMCGTHETALPAMCHSEPCVLHMAVFVLTWLWQLAAVAALHTCACVCACVCVFVCVCVCV